ncbi:hypothetical protein [Simplicispira metamorpha]|uniref:hypothetical protein n=1 Tax=Simplicispira metamorpha TaxID=80881 RepID=UPI0013001879|nr:hypothetical protein [Simplicispira metamorpha]
MKNIPYLVCRFGKDTLSNVVKESFGSEFPDVFHKQQIDYIFRYLKGLGGKTIVLEFDYVDKDYLDDFSRFYVRRFGAKGYKCARLHFFSTEFDHAKMEDFILGGGLASGYGTLQDQYLGFFVVKPLPKTFIGKTCLKAYECSDQDAMHKKITRTYSVNLFGIKLSINSVAFQEQDKVVSACAATAIWTALHALSWRSIREIPSCSEITIDAINHIEGSSNSFPSRELSNKQIMRALDVQGLKHHSDSTRGLDEISIFRLVKGYIDSNLPVIFGVVVYGIEKDGKLTRKAGHAITVLGYKDWNGLGFYVHDDRLGPYARSTFEKSAKYSSSPDDRIPDVGLVLQTKNDENQWQPPTEFLVPEIIIAASDKKVRLPLGEIIKTATVMTEALNSAMHQVNKNISPKSNTDINEDYTYSVRLAEIGDIKSDIFSKFGERKNTLHIDPATEEKVLLSLLFQSFARMQWVIDIQKQNSLLATILLDATEINQGDAVTAVVSYDPQDRTVDLLKKVGTIAINGEENSPRFGFLQSFLRHLNKQESNFNDYLRVTYGDLRAPAYLKYHEHTEGIINGNPTMVSFRYSSSESLIEFYERVVGESADNFLIWVISEDGQLIIGRELNKMGHPCLTGFKPARIGGELHRTGEVFFINSRSGRYSRSYRNSMEYLENALERFRCTFWKSRDIVNIQYYK